jgi:hypothetical protein
MTGSSQVFVRDLSAGTTALASRTSTGPPAASAANPSFSADGSRLAVTTDPFDNSGPGFNFPQIFVRDLATGGTTLVSVRRDGAGPARLGAFQASLSGNGACVAFASRSDDLVSPSYGPDFEHVFLRTLNGGCAAATTGGGGGSGGGGGGGGGGGHRPDRTPPRITAARLTNRRFAVAGGRTALLARTPRGTAFVFKLSENARTTITITRNADGRRSGRRCVAPRRGLVRRCTRAIVVLTLTRSRTRTGSNRVAFSGRAGRTMLKPGRYGALLLARDPAGNRSKPVSLAFTVVGR